jgi:hypothetical protein
MPKHTYQLINPVIEGTFKDVYDANEAIDAAKIMWSALSEHIVAHVPKFIFTLRDISSGNLHHFEVAENRSSNSFTINKRDINIDKKVFDEYAKKIDQYNNAREKQQGGHRKRYDDDSSSSSSSSSSTDYPIIRRTSPVAMFHYNTRVYYTNTKMYESTLNPQAVAITTPIFTPIFRPVLGTFVGIWP